jgi:sortase A
MSYYRYIKGPVTVLFPPGYRRRSRVSRILAPVMITLGSLLMANVAWPILYYQLVTAPSLRPTEFVSPLPPSTANQIASVSISPSHVSDTPQVLGNEVDYTDPSTWFPQAAFGVPGTGQAEYYLSIPSLNIESARVVVNGQDLDKNLIHYQGTALPGQLGSPVIFGHSVLRQFYNPSIDNPDRYISIFSKLMTLKNTDKIYIDFDGIRYTYEVKDRFEVKPEDIYVLEQRYTNKELKLITCVPEGTYLRRGVILAQLVNLE